MASHDEHYDGADMAEDMDGGSAMVEDEQTGTAAQQSDDSAPAPTLAVHLPSKKPKAVGGFVDSDSEDDDDTPAPRSLATAATQAIDDNDAEEYDPSQLTTDNYNPAPQAPAQTHPQTQELPVQTAPPGPEVHAPTVPVPHQAPAASAPAVPFGLPLGQDSVAALEARIKEDSRGAVDSWLTLIAEHRRNNRFDDARSVFNRFLQVFPQAGEVWVDFIEMELELENFAAAEELFGRSLTTVVNVPLWVVYLDYVRRRNNLNDAGSEARAVVNRAYEFVLEKIGVDKDSGRVWQDYVQFIRSGPGTIGGSGWQDQQKMDQLRKAFRRATSVPISNVNQLWKEYDQFEMGLNKITGRKFLAERSPAYMSAKSANTGLENLLRGLNRTTISRLPPVAGFEGHQEYMQQVDLWLKWVDWEKSDPLDLHMDEPEVLKARILYCYKQALMPLRFWPELWVEAAEWCFDNDIKENDKDKGLDFLVDGIEANPESILLALKHADRIESTYPTTEGDEAKIARGLAVREPYDRIIKTLRDLHKSLQDREKTEVTRMEEIFAAAAPAAANANNNDDDDDEDNGRYNNGEAKKTTTNPEHEQKIALIKQGFAAQMDLVSKCLTHVWIALARAMRRIQGKGSPTGALGGMRAVFAEARKGGRLKSDIYVAVAKMEWKCYNDKSGGKILERGAKLFPEDPYFMIEYIKYLTAHGDNTNSRVVFETCVNRLAQKPETVHKAKPLLSYMHKHEAEYGDLARVIELEKRMAELYPNDPKLLQFGKRFATEKFDPVTARIIISPSAQLRPRLVVLPSVEKQSNQNQNQNQPPSLRNSPMPNLRATSPRPQYGAPPGGVASPKRPYDDDDANAPPRKILRQAEQREFQRGESPLKGAAGRRLDQQRRLQAQQAPAGGAGGGMGGGYGGGGGHGGYGGGGNGPAPPPPLPTMVTFLLGQIPPATQYNGLRYIAPALVHLLRETEIDPNAAYEAGRRAGRVYGGGRGGHGGQHARQVSGSEARDGRGNSPFTGGNRNASGGYRQSSLRPESQDSYEPPPAPGQYGYRY
ncbi:mrna 3 -end-processing protein rna-14 [Ophiostoma piceae UAMH 11346]|uniref:mRNA 3'-end-processing protein RNA14 n=1 Tax=Ophiostoma piceae (strain UAMH 11346) TaxID=1262450 RepID=S3BPP3_OPHP1|nr:mrna 3 -end-processing protein rna-14 [Ophiostoma piceae UAMH 11346]